MNQVKKSVKYVTKRATQKESVNPPVGTVKNQATGIGIALKRRTEAEARAEERKEIHPTPEKEISRIKGKVLHILKTERTIKVARTTAYVTTVHQNQSQRMTELQTPDPGQILSQALKMKPLKKEKSLKEEILNQGITRIIASLPSTKIGGWEVKPTLPLLLKSGSSKRQETEIQS